MSREEQLRWEARWGRPAGAAAIAAAVLFLVSGFVFPPKDRDGIESYPDALLSIDAGSGPKEIVAGIKAAYTKEQLVGRSIVVVDNLEPATIRGVQSNGMLLAAKDAAGLALLAPDRDVPPGSLVG